MPSFEERLRAFIDDEMTFPGNPDTICGEIIRALNNEAARVALIELEQMGTPRHDLPGM